MAATLEGHLFAPGPKRVLSLDGGGVKGIITIAFLEKIEETLRVQSGRGEQFRLSDYFDLVGGTSVGSLLATLIALGYSMADIKTMFQACAFDIFKPALGIPLLSPRFSSRGLRKQARKVLGERSLESPDLKTGLGIITKRIDTGSPWVLTNNPRGKFWDDPPDHSYMGNRHYRLADLVCASTAAPYYFAPKRIRIVSRRRRDVAQQTGLFVDGGVSPFNNPSVMLLMLASIKGYGFQWDLGANNLFLVSVGTGSYRMRLNPGFWTRHFSAGFAVDSLRGLVADADVLSLTLLQWLSAPRRPWEINSEIGTLQGELLGLTDTPGSVRPTLSFVRYDARLEKTWLSENCAEVGREVSDEYVQGLQQLDRPEMMDDMYRVGVVAAGKQVTLDDFPEEFEATGATRRMALA